MWLLASATVAIFATTATGRAWLMWLGAAYASVIIGRYLYLVAR